MTTSFEDILHKTLIHLQENPLTFLDSSLFESLSPDERDLLEKLLTLVNDSPAEHTKDVTFIGFFGPLGVGKTTLAATLTTKLGAQFIIKEPYLTNPFWKYSQTDSTYMLRSQLYFLLSNIFSDIDAITQNGIAISDTSTLTDIVMWAQWYYEIGHLSQTEYELYQRCVYLLKNNIPRPTTLVTLIPDNVDHLFAGIRQRQEAETSRKGELVFSREDLQAQIDRVMASAAKIEKEWNTPVCTITVNPSELYTNLELKQNYIKKIMSCVNSNTS